MNDYLRELLDDRDATNKCIFKLTAYMQTEAYANLHKSKKTLKMVQLETLKTLLANLNEQIKLE